MKFNKPDSNQIGPSFGLRFSTSPGPNDPLNSPIPNDPLNWSRITYGPIFSC